MEIARGRADNQPSQLRSDTFTGTVYGDPVLAEPGMFVGNVWFAPEARTYWHSHSGGQVLEVAKGRGLVANRDGVAHFIEASDVVHAHGGEEHWHGGTADSFVIHTAISVGTTNWLEEVTETDYRAAHVAAEKGQTS